MFVLEGVKWKDNKRDDELWERNYYKILDLWLKFKEFKVGESIVENKMFFLLEVIYSFIFVNRIGFRKDILSNYFNYKFILF